MTGARSPSGPRDAAGAGLLLLLAARRDRVMIPAWLLAITATVAATVGSYQGMYADPAALRAVAAQVTGSPALIATSGPPFDLLSVGGLSAWKVGGFLAALAAVLNTLLVVRHTRAEEDAGRLELVRAAAVGPVAASSAALLLAVATDVLVAVLVAAGCLAYGLGPAGALALGAATALAGFAFAGLALLSAQLLRSPRAATAAGGLVLAATYALRAVGDSTGPGWLSWLGPVGWAQQVRPYAHERWWVLLLPLAAGAALGAAGLALSRRDLGAALVADRDGPANGTVGTLPGLAWRLQRGGFAVWLAGFLACGLLFGAVVPGLTGSAATRQLADVLAELGGTGGLAGAFAAAMARIAGLLVAVQAMTSVVRLRAEESAGLAEPVLAARVGRLRWAGSYLSVALAETALLLCGFGACLAAGDRLAGGSRAAGGVVAGASPGLGLDPLAGALLQLPAVWVVAGATVLLFGLAPRRTALGWAVLGVVLGISWLGPLIRLDHRVLDLSPFTHVPSVPGGDLRWAPELWLVVAAAILVGAGLAGWRRRDLTP